MAGNTRRPGGLLRGTSTVPLLSESSDDAQDTERGRPSNERYLHGPPTSRPSTMSRRTRSTMRSRSPSNLAATSARKKYTYAAIFLTLSLVAFCVQTELSSYIQGELGWKKAYCMMFVTHSSWTLLWPIHLLILRVQKWNMPWDTFWRRHTQLLKSSALMVELHTLDVFGLSRPTSRSIKYIVRCTILITCSLTIAGLSWYIAVSMTNPSDLTAIYNCSTFFAYAFSVPLLKEPLRMDKSISVVVAIVGVLIVAYGDGGSENGEGPNPGSDSGTRLLGNMVIGVGSVLYGLYEVLYKRLACGPETMSTGRTVIFSNFFASCIGFFTLTVLWIPLVFLDLFNIENFVIPNARTCWLIALAVFSNMTFSGSFLILIALTSPVLSSVSALLTIFIIAVTDWIITGQPLSSASIFGGSLIILAFLALSWSSYIEMTEHQLQKKKVDLTDSDDDDEEDD
ncbi:putative vacuolar membrane protein [Cladobotryum mycophilum]|uniref:Vacuolar membrane protein n=1 Tax=Cladobotryum mycophilum TaxID=491253 RepID=A0ABR0SJI0_9HYPO